MTSQQVIKPTYFAYRLLCIHYNSYRETYAKIQPIKSVEFEKRNPRQERPAGHPHLAGLPYLVLEFN